MRAVSVAKKEKTPSGVKLSLRFFNEVTGPETSASADSATGANMKKRVLIGSFNWISRREEQLEFMHAIIKTHGRIPSTNILYHSFSAVSNKKLERSYHVIFSVLKKQKFYQKYA